MLFLEFFFVFVTQIHHRLHVHFIEGSQDGVFLLRSQQTLGYTGTQAAHRHALFRAITQRQRCSRRRSFSGSWAGVLYVFFQNATIAAGTLYAVDVHAFFSSQFSGSRHSHTGLAIAGSSRGSGRCGSSRCCFGGRCRSAGGSFGIDFSQQLLRFHYFAVLNQNFHQHTGLRRGHFQHHFIGFDVDQHFVASHGFTDFFMPRKQSAFRYALRKYRYFYFNNHFFLQML